MVKVTAFTLNESHVLCHFSKTLNASQHHPRWPFSEQVVGNICQCLATWPRTRLPPPSSSLDKPVHGELSCRTMRLVGGVLLKTLTNIPFTMNPGDQHLMTLHFWTLTVLLDRQHKKVRHSKIEHLYGELPFQAFGEPPCYSGLDVNEQQDQTNPGRKKTLCIYKCQINEIQTNLMVKKDQIIQDALKRDDDDQMNLSDAQWSTRFLL